MSVRTPRRQALLVRSAMHRVRLAEECRRLEPVLGWVDAGMKVTRTAWGVAGWVGSSGILGGMMGSKFRLARWLGWLRAGLRLAGVFAEALGGAANETRRQGTTGKLELGGRH